MKIGIVSNLYPPEARGGAELVAQRIADALYEQGHQVFVLTTQPYDGMKSLFPRVRERTLEAVYRFYPINVYHLTSDGHIPFPIRMFWHVFDLINPFSRGAIRSVIHDEDPDVIITHNLKGIGVSIAREIQKQGIPHIHTLHDVQLTIPSGLLIAGSEECWLNRSLLRRIYECAVRSQIGKPNIVISPSRFLSEFYKKRNFFKNTHIEILPNPLPPEPTRPRKDRLSNRTQFLYVGQLEKHKGIRELLDAMDTFGDNVELHIAGEGTLSNMVYERSQLDSRINFHGFVSLNHLMRLLETMDAVLVPSVCYENSPTVIYESYQAGVPVIASRIGGIPELLKEGETGLLIDPGSAIDLSRAMKEIHDHRDHWWSKTLQIQAQAEQYSIQNYIARLGEFINKIV